MVPFNIFKRKKQQPKEIKANNELNKKSKPIISMHYDLQGLIWIGDGPYKNYIADKDKRKIFELDGAIISISFMRTDEPSLIYTSQKVSIPKNEKEVQRPSYFPTYTQLTPEQKWIYLKLLSNPYDTSIDIGYIFILYYGLERHLLCGDFENAFKVILKLRDFHPNKSFQSYSANSLVLTSMLHRRGDLAFEFIRSIDKEHELDFSDNLFLICYYSFDMPLNAKDLMRMAKTFEINNTNYIKKYPEFFEECLKTAMFDRLGKENFEINKYITKNELKKIKTKDTPIFANISISNKTYPVPMLADNFKLKKEINLLLETAHEMVKQKLSKMRKSGIKIPVAEIPKKTKKIIEFDTTKEMQLLQELENYKNSPLKRHFCYIQLQDFYYKYREVDIKYLNKCIDYCYLDINSLEDMKQDYINQNIKSIKKLAKFDNQLNEQKEIERAQNEGFFGKIPAFRRLAIIYEKNGNLDKAIEICDMAILYGESIDSFMGRKERLLEKINTKLQ